MQKIGIIAEYNPFHNGHLYQIEKIKEKYKDSLIIVVLTSSFNQRGNISILTKEEKTKICLENNIDLIIELPTYFTVQSADVFAYAGVKLLNELNVDFISFGSESNDLDKLMKIANTQINNKKFNKLVKENLNLGINYPTALNNALKTLTGYEVNEPNDLLGVSYLKEIIKNDYKIKPLLIKRTNTYKDVNSNEEIISSNNIREKLNNNLDIKKYVPTSTYNYLKDFKINNKYFDYLKYKIISEENLSIYKTVDEGIDSRIKSVITSSNSLEELINNIKTKRYTYNKISRMLTHILLGIKKDDDYNLEYIRILGFNNKGKNYLKEIKNKTNLKILTKYKKGFKLLEFESRVTNIYNLITSNTLEDYKYKIINKE